MDSGGTDTWATINRIWTSAVLSGGLTASGSTAFDFSGSTGTFLTSTGLNTFGGSGHAFASILYPSTNDGAALGDATHNFSDLFLAGGGVINWNNGNVLLTHTSGVLTLGTGNLIITTAGTAAGSVLTNDGTQTATNKTLTSPVINGATSSGSTAINLGGNSGTFTTPSGTNVISGLATFASDAKPAVDGTGNLGTAALSWDNLYLDTLATINFDNGNAVVTHSSGVLTVSTGDLRVTTAGTNAASAVTVGGTQTLTNKTLTSPVIGTGLTASGSAANTFAGSTGTFITSTGANTFKGSAHNFDAVLQPTTDDAAALGTTLLGFSDLFLADGGTLHFANTDWVATHTTGILTVGTGDLRVTTAGTNAASVVTVGGTQTLTAKTLTSPTLTGPSISGTSAFTGAITTTGAITQTSASATAFSSGLNGATNPVFQLVNNVASQATGISITGRAAAAGADITVLSSGTNESLVVNAKGSGTILLNGTATGGVYVGDVTNPAFSVIHTTEGTGVSVTSAAAASGVAIAATGGTNESMTLDAKGTGTLTLNGTATGDVIIGNGRVTPQVTVITGDGAITIESGVVVLTKGSAAAITLAAPSSQNGTTITITSTTDFAHVVTVTGGMWDGTATTNTTVTFPVVAGAAVTLMAYGTDWYVINNQGTTIAP